MNKKIKYFFNIASIKEFGELMKSYARHIFLTTDQEVKGLNPFGVTENQRVTMLKL